MKNKNVNKTGGINCKLLNKSFGDNCWLCNAFLKPVNAEICKKCKEKLIKRNG